MDIYEEEEKKRGENSWFSVSISCCEIKKKRIVKTACQLYISQLKERPVYLSISFLFRRVNRDTGYRHNSLL